ncbi:MAG: UvrD-helicase domain-containing protein, partial [Eggerthellaceae bacterium]|nr:UvrD-helicase domain-containing protein [Eggerthellaceae bacterium]
MNYLDELNEDQLRAATHSEGYLRVIAGAGSGKTRMLVARYAYLVDAMGIDPASILCVTFTNKAAAEMRSRIRALIGDGHDTSLISTYHGFCVRMLREDADKIFYPTSFQIIDTAAQKDILREIYDELELKLDFASFEKVLKAISDFKADETYVSQMISRDASAGPVDEGILPEIIRRYLARQKRLNLMDFEDLIHFGLYLLRTCPDVREKWQQRLNYVQVDEFQDSSAREMELVDILSGGYGNLMVVGDPDQNIYEWRGSDVSLLVDFDETHVPTETTTLALNYRSTNAILACANELIRHNKLRIEKDLRPANPGNVGSKPIHYHAKTEEAEATWIAERIHEGVQGGRAYSNYAVLYRASHLSRMIENALVEANIPYEVRGGVAFYRRMEVLDAIAYLKLITRKDDLAFKRIVNKPPRKMGRVRIAKLQEMAKPDEPLVDALARCIDNKTFKGSGAAR